MRSTRLDMIIYRVVDACRKYVLYDRIGPPYNGVTYLHM